MPTTSFEDLTRLHSSGKVDESMAAVRRLLRSADGQDAATGAFFALWIDYYKKFGAALAVLAPAFKAYESNFEACRLVAFGAFVLKDLELGTAASRRGCIALMPARSEGYIRLGMLLMLFERFREAYEVLSEGLSRCTADAGALRHWWAVGERRMRCDDPVTVPSKEWTRWLRIATFSGHALEASRCSCRDEYATRGAALRPGLCQTVPKLRRGGLERRHAHGRLRQDPPVGICPRV